jgi:hypothetical protein
VGRKGYSIGESVEKSRQVQAEGEAEAEAEAEAGKAVHVDVGDCFGAGLLLSHLNSVLALVQMGHYPFPAEGIVMIDGPGKCSTFGSLRLEAMRRMGPARATPAIRTDT